MSISSSATTSTTATIPATGNDSDPSGDVGPITGDMIVGRARFVFWPLSEIRSID